MCVFVCVRAHKHTKIKPVFLGTHYKGKGFGKGLKAIWKFTENTPLSKLPFIYFACTFGDCHYYYLFISMACTVAYN